MTKLTQDDQVPNGHQQSTFACFLSFFTVTSFPLSQNLASSIVQLYKEWKFTYIVPLSCKKFSKLIPFSLYSL
jgi:hypothetical protein